MSEPLPIPLWLEQLQRPLCDVPWLGRSVVLSDGKVNFCCFSGAVVGNVNEQPLAEIWRGPTMRRIRKELAAQRFPPECRSTSCPIFRGDRDTYLHTRMDGVHHATAGTASDPLAPSRGGLAGSGLRVEPAEAGPGDLVRATLDIQWRGPARTADLFAGRISPGGDLRFEPEASEAPLPLRSRLLLDESVALDPIVVFEQRLDADTPVGRWWIGAALFLEDGNPTARADCLWSGRATFVVRG